MADTGKAPESDADGDFAGGLCAFLGVSDDEDGEFSLDVAIKEEMVEEVMKQLLNEINSSGASRSSSSPPSMELSPACPQPFISAGSNKESCGPSFSASVTTMMAGVEVGGGSTGRDGFSCFPKPTVEASGGDMNLATAAGYPFPVAEGMKVLMEKMDGCDGKEGDDEWLARVLSWGPQELDEWI